MIAYFVLGALLAVAIGAVTDACEAVGRWIYR